MAAYTILRFSKLFLWSAVVWLPCLVYWAAQVRMGTPEVSAWLPGDDAARVTYRQFLDEFGDDQILFVTWPGCNLQDPRLPQMAEQLKDLARTHPQLGISRVGDSASMLQQWLSIHPELTLAAAQQKLQGFAIGAGGSCFIALHVAAEPGPHRAELVDALRQLAQRAIAVAPSELILAGEPFQVYVIDRASRETIQRYVVPSALLALVIAWLCLRSIRLTLLVFVLAGLGQLVGLALIAVFVGEMSAVQVVLPTLIFMLTLSGAVHLTNYYRDARAENAVEQTAVGASARLPDPGSRALVLGAWPCALATLTTIFGFGSLLVSQLQPVSQFGSLAAAGLFLSTALLLCLFPAAVSLFEYRPGNAQLPQPPKTQPPKTQPPKTQPPKTQPPKTQPPKMLSDRAKATVARSAIRSRATPATDTAVDWLTRLTARYSGLICGVGIALLLLSIVGLSRLQTSTVFEDMFPPSSPAIQSLRWVQTHLGPINSLEVIVAFPKPASDNPPVELPVELPAESTVESPTRSPRGPSTGPDVLAQAQVIAAIHADLERSQHVAGVLSAATFLPSLATGKGTRATIRRAVLRRTLAAHRGDLKDQHLLAERPDAWAWRLSVRLATPPIGSEREIQSRLSQAIQSGLEAVDDSGTLATQPTFAITGLRAVIDKAHVAMLSDLGGSFAMAFLLIIPVMMLIARGVVAGLALMLPNVLPVALVFGSMGWFSVKLDVASILTASVALGIAVDDTLHFVTWFLRGRRQGLDSTAAVRQAIAGCARAMLHTSIICTGSMLPFFFSDFLPTSKFALLMIMILVGAIVGDLILLPAVLQSRLGSNMGVRPTPHNSYTPNPFRNRC